MEITLRDLLGEDEIRGIINGAVDDILRQVITLNVGTAIVGTLPNTKTKTLSFTCEICGKTGFTAKAAMGGHQYWAHDISNKMTPEQVRAKKAEKKAAKAEQERQNPSQTEKQLAVRQQATE